MAKRKKTHKARRRSVGGMSLNPKSTVVKLVSVAAGYFLADTINGQIDKVIVPAPVTATSTGFSLDKNTLVMAGQVGIGSYLLLKKGKASLLTVIPGGLLAGAGLKRALKKFGIVSGYQSVPIIGRRHRMAGYQSVPVIGGMPGQLSGTPLQLQGFRVNGYRPTGSKGVGVMGSMYSGRGVNGSGSGITNTGGGGCMS